MSILEHMNQMEFSINEEIFHSLIFAHCKFGELPDAEKIINIMKNKGLEVDRLAYTAKIKGMIASGHDISIIEEEITQHINQGIFFDDADYYAMVVAFCEKENVEAAKIILEKLPHNSGYFQKMRNALPKLIFAGQQELAVQLLISLRIDSGSEEYHVQLQKPEYGFFLLRVMVNGDISPREILKTLGQLKGSDEKNLVLISRMIDHYIAEGKFKEGAEFIKLAKLSYDNDFLNDPVFCNNIRRHVVRHIKTVEGSTDLMINVAKMGLPMRYRLINEGFFASLMRPMHEGTVANKLFYVINRVDEKKAPIATNQIVGACIDSILRFNDSKVFKETATMLTLWKHSEAHHSNRWKHMLAENYLRSNDMDSLLAFMIYTSTLQFWLKGQDLPSRGKYFS